MLYCIKMKRKVYNIIIYSQENLIHFHEEIPLIMLPVKNFIPLQLFSIVYRVPFPSGYDNDSTMCLLVHYNKN